MRLPKLRLNRSSDATTQRRFQVPEWLLALTAFLLAGVIALLFSWAAVLLIERRTERAVRTELKTATIEWVTVQADGLHLELSGTAPNEAARFRAVNLAGKVIDAERIRDLMEVTPASAIKAPRFSVEMLRNDDGIQLIGLLPDEETSIALTAAATGLSASAPVSAMLETAAYPAPENWQAAYDYGVAALKLLPRSKISVAADRVEITAIAASETEKRRLELELGRSRPQDVDAVITISAPRPVLTPFPLRFVMDGEGARFDACAADTDAARTRILAAAAAAGMAGTGTCTVGLGVPTPRWAEAAEAGIRAVAALGAGTITFADADVSLMASEEVPQAVFDRVVGDLQAALPPVFSLDATLPKKENAVPAGPAEFTAELASSGRVEMRGRLTDEMQRDAIDNFAKAQFGVGNVLTATRLDTELPDGWPVRVLAGLAALAELESGKLLVRPDVVEIAGVTGSQQARGKISQILSGKLGQGQTFKVAVRYDESLDPLAALPTPEECVAKVQGLLSERKIAFPPGSAEIDASARDLMNALAEALTDCPDLPLEIGGHTDAQGSEEGNRALSQARAEAVLVALQGRRVDVSRMKAVGYGESRPVADNDSDEGREANRRIEVTLIGARPATATLAAPETNNDGKSGPVIKGTTVAARPVPANAQACVADVQTLLKKQKITFKPGSAEITDQAAGLMMALATLFKQCQGVAVEIGGHTDSQGTERNNRVLSQQRAEAVLAVLNEKGVDTSAMTAVGYGEDKPIAENETEEGRETNRRIEFVLSGAVPDEAQAAVTAAGDDPSLAPTEKTLRPKARPANND
jgi:OmpA-OmpF porin, OOP family